MPYDSRLPNRRGASHIDLPFNLCLRGFIMERPARIPLHIPSRKALLLNMLTGAHPQMYFGHDGVSNSEMEIFSQGQEHQGITRTWPDKGGGLRPPARRAYGSERKGPFMDGNWFRCLIRIPHGLFRFSWPDKGPCPLGR